MGWISSTTELTSSLIFVLCSLLCRRWLWECLVLALVELVAEELLCPSLLKRKAKKSNLIQKCRKRSLLLRKGMNYHIIFASYQPVLFVGIKIFFLIVVNFAFIASSRFFGIVHTYVIIWFWIYHVCWAPITSKLLWASYSVGIELSVWKSQDLLHAWCVMNMYVFLGSRKN